jgi:hypothetical protein
MPPPHHFFMPAHLELELIFTVTAVTFCFLIYFKTKETYQLTKHKGIGHFRDAFLFFGLSYLIRFILNIIMLSLLTFDFFPGRIGPNPFFILILGYFSTIGIFYLILSSAWKKLGNKKMLISAHSIAILVSLVSFITRSPLILLYLQCALLLVAVMIRFIVPQKEKKKLSQAKVLYVLVGALWLINLLIIDQRRPIGFELQLVAQIISILVFAIIYHKVTKWVK